MTPEDHRQLQRQLRSDRGFAERLARYVEQPANEDGIPFRRRFGVRSGILQISQRMAAQSPALVTDPLIKKVRRIQAGPRSTSEQARLLAARMGQEAFWAHQEKMALLHEAWLTRIASSNTTPSSNASVTAAGQAEPAQRTPGQSTARSGLIIMGFGAGCRARAHVLGIAEATAVEGFIVPAIILESRSDRF